MLSASYKTRLATVMAGAALACTLIVSGASAMPARDSVGAASKPSGHERSYTDLRTPDARDAGQVASTPKVAERTYTDLRSPDARDASDGYRPTVGQPVTSEPFAPGGFDWVSAAIGGAGTGLVLILLVGLASSGRLGHLRPVRHGTAGS